MRRLLIGAFSLAALGLSALATPACGSDADDGAGGGGTSGGTDDGGCIGFGCPGPPDTGTPRPPKVCVDGKCSVECDGGPLTTLTGTVLDPRGKVPIFNATVFIPAAPLGDIAEGVSACDRCDAQVTGKPAVIATTDTSGNFKLENVPVGDNIPLVVQIGKWRRRVEIPTVPACVTTALDGSLTRLPKNRTEGHIPRIALTTGAADALQCLLRKVGIEDSEFGIAGSDARIHLYKGSGFTQGGVPKNPSSKFASGTAFPDAQPFWSDVNNIKKYDVVLLSCEGDENLSTKPDAAKTALYDYAKVGGRIFASHYHYAWFSKSPDAVVKGVANWAPVDGVTGFNERTPPAVPANPATTPVSGDISTAFPKAVAMNDWLGKQGALISGKLPIYDARHNIDSVTTNSLSWITVPPSSTITAPGNPVQYMTFNTPIGAAADAVCGRVVVSDIHVAAGTTPDDATGDFPTGCNTADLNGQQKALEFMLFDLSSCVQKDDDVIQGPR